jgi:hypothetical protein
MRAGSDTAARYRCEAASVAGFIQQLAVGCVARGYWFYVTGCIPLTKPASAVDQKLIERYRIACSKWARCRRKDKGFASVQYLRFRQFFILLATPGDHDFFREETRIQDVRRTPIRCFGYSIGCYRKQGSAWHASVRIERSLFSDLKAELLSAARHETVEQLCSRFAHLRFEPYAPVRQQIFQALRAVNDLRVVAGLEPIPTNVVRLKRMPVRPFRHQ